MAEQVNVVQLMERQAVLIDRLKIVNMDELVDIIEELSAINPVLRQHIRLQKRIQAATFGDKYTYDKKGAKLDKIFEEKE